MINSKAALISILNTFITNLKNYNDELLAVKESENYTDDYKNSKLKKLEENNRSKFDVMRDRAQVIIDQQITHLTRLRTKNSAGKFSNTGYQIGLTNALTMLESDVITSPTDFKALVDVYKDDVNAIALIKKKIPTTKHSELQRFLPTDNFEKNIDFLTRTRKHITTYIDQLNIDGILGQITDITRLYNDDLSLSETENIL